MNRREFMAAVAGGAATVGGVVCTSFPAHASDSATDAPGNQIGVLVDTTKCIGCRKCEYACARANRPNGTSIESYKDMSVFDSPRRMTHDALTVVNRHANPVNPSEPIYVKSQCMHCLRPNCVSACIVGALHKKSNGTVSYDVSKCIGCRYCMLACPFEVPAYEYNNILTPKVQKCTFCYETYQARGEPPACVQICPPNCLTFAMRDDLLEMAHAKIEADPDAYYPHVYGEAEAGGTSWLYLTSRPAEELGFLKVPAHPLPHLTENLQHSIFKYGIPPMLLYGLLAIAMKVSEAEEKTEPSKAPHE